MSYLITIDVGTSSTKTALWSDNDNIAAEATYAYQLQRPDPLWAEIDPLVWWQAIGATVQSVMTESALDPREIAGIGVDAVGWTLVPVDEQINPLHPAMLWLDRRAEVETAQLKALPNADQLVQLVANPLDAAYITPKLLWLKTHYPRLFERAYRFLDATGFIVAKLTGEFTCDYTQAYGYHFFDIANERWDAQIADQIGVPVEKMPRLCPCTEIVGDLTTQAAEALGLVAGIPVMAGCLDAAAGALGAGVTGWQVGDRVAIDPTLEWGGSPVRETPDKKPARFMLLGEAANGTYAEYITVPARNLLALPDHVTYAEAAAASLVFVTAWHSLITRGQLRAGESVLIVGAGGGVNTACIQIAKLAGCTVYVVGSTEDKIAQAKALGADVGVPRDVDGGWSRAIYQLTAKRGVDVVVDNVGAATMNDSLRSTARGGRLLTVGNTAGAMIEIDNRLIFGKHLTIIGSTMGPHEDYVTVMRLLFKGQLRAVIDATYPLERAQDAHRLMEAGGHFGKIVLEI